jgi:uncharacterized protein YndB with AHSA1/START domain
MKIVIYIVAALVALILLTVIIGYTLPVAHQASREKRFARSPSEVFAVISTPADYPKWRPDVKSVEILPPESGKARFREVSGDGTILFEVVASQPPTRLVTRIADRTLPFGGQWTFELSPAGTGTTLRITEDGEVYNPFFRFMSRFVFGHGSTIERYLANLEAFVGNEQP